MEKGGAAQTSFTKSLEVQGESNCRWRRKQEENWDRHVSLPEYLSLGKLKGVESEKANLNLSSITSLILFGLR